MNSGIDKPDQPCTDGHTQAASLHDMHAWYSAQNRPYLMFSFLKLSQTLNHTFHD